MGQKAIPNTARVMKLFSTGRFTFVVFLWVVIQTMPCSAQPCVRPPAGLVSWWRAEGDATDTAGIHHGNFSGGLSFVAGQVGQAFGFDGVDDQIVVSNSPALSFGAGQDFSIEAWVQPEVSTTSFDVMTVVDSRNAPDTSHGIGYEVALIGGKLECRISDSLANAGTTFGTAGPDLRDGNFHHVAVTIDRDSTNGGHYFVDGVAVLTFNPTVEPGNLASGQPLRIGVHPTPTVFANFKGRMDELSIYSRALPVAEVQAIFQAGVAGKCTNSGPFVVTQPVSRTVPTGAAASFTVLAGGTPPLSYAWFFGTNRMENATNAVLALSDVTTNQSGAYSVLITNLHGAVTSSNAILLVAPPQPCIAPVSGLVHWWAAEGDVADSTGTLHGNLYGGTTFAPGKVGVAFSFDGVNDSVTNTQWGLTSILDTYTMELWVAPTAGRAVTSEVTSGFPGNGNQRYAIFPREGPTGGTVGAGISVGTNGVSVFEHGNGYMPSLLVYNAPILGWNHIAVVYSNRCPRLYLNGALVRTGLTSQNPSCPSTWLGERGAANLNQGPYAGLIDEVSIYNRMLSAAEIQAIYVAGSDGKCRAATAPFIVTQPTNQTVLIGAAADLAVLAGGAPPLSYAWFFGTNRIADATNAVLALNNVTTNQAGVYSVEVTNYFGAVLSSDAFLAVVPPPPCAGSTGVISWWRGEGDSEGAVGGEGGTLMNGATFAAGKVGQAFAFDGVDDYIHVADRPGFHVTNALTVEAWVYPTSHGAYHTIISKWDVVFGPAQKSYNFTVHPGGQFALGMCADGNDAILGSVISTNTLPLNQWSHVCGTYDGAAIRLYLNGNYQTQSLYTNGILPGTNALGIGGVIGGGAPGQVSYSFAGRIDEPAVYNRALSAAEVQAIYDASVVGKCFSPVGPAITLQPAALSANLSNAATFRVSVTGTSPFSYQWRLNGNNLTAATNSVLTVTNALPSKAGAYSVAVTNAAGFAISDGAQLKVKVLAASGNGQPLTNSFHIFGTNVTISLQNFFDNGLIFYTLDGSTPSFFSSQYAVPFLVTQSATLRVLAYSADFFEAGESDPVTILIPPSYPLALTNGGGGSVSANPTPGPYLSNTVVTITATPNAGWMFLQWLGDASGGSAVTNLTMNRAKAVQAIFGTTLGTTAANGGYVMLNPPGGIYPYGTTVQLSAIPSNGNFFAIWGNAAGGNVNPLNFVLTNANPTVSSLFAPVPGGQAALTVIPVGMGSISVSPRANAYATGSGVTIMATPEAGQVFLGWSGDASGTQNPLPLTLNASALIYANFTRQPRLDVLTAASRIRTDGLGLKITGRIGDRYDLTASPNLFDWTTLLSYTNSVGETSFTDGEATNAGWRFYRAVVLP